MKNENIDDVVERNLAIAKKFRRVHVQDIYEQEKDQIFKAMDKSNPYGWRGNKKLVKRIKKNAYQTAKNKVSAYNLANQIGLPPQDVMNYVAHMKAYMHCSTDVAFNAVQKRAKENVELLKHAIIGKDKVEK